MKLYPRTSDHLLYLILLWCVFSFKVLIWGVGEAGSRVDDLLIVIAFGLLMLRGDLLRIPRSGPVRAYLVFLLINLFSSGWNAWMGRVPFVYSALFSVRLVQYLVFYYIGYALMEGGVNVWRGLRVYFYLLCVVVPLQLAYVIPVANRFGGGRASGNTNGPYELATVATFFFCFFFFQERKRLNAAAAFGMLLLTASRITVFGTIVSVTWRWLRQSRVKLNLLVVGSVTMVVAVAAGAVMLLSLGNGNAPAASADAANPSTSTVTARFLSAFTLIHFDQAQALVAAAPTYQTSENYISGMFVDSLQLAQGVDADTSGMLRIFRWVSLVKSAAMHADSEIIGLGPSFGSAAVDGYFVRIFIESGIAGIAAFFFFLRSLMKRTDDQTGAFRAFVLTLIVTSCFIDIFTSYKTMLFFWMWHGMNEYQARQRSDANSIPNAG